MRVSSTDEPDPAIAQLAELWMRTSEESRVAFVDLFEPEIWRSLEGVADLQSEHSFPVTITCSSEK